MSAPLAAVSGVILAAGQAARFAGPLPKQLTPFRGVPLVRRSAEAACAAQLAEVIVVVGHAGREVVALLSDLALKVVWNPDFAAGQSTSVKAGLRAVASSSAAVLFLPCDQPWLESAVLDQLIAAHAAHRGQIIVPTGNGRRGAPVLWDRRFFSDLSALSGDVGGRALLAQFPDAVVEVPVRAQALADIDTWDDFVRLAAW